MPDIHAVREAMHGGQTEPAEQMEKCIAAARSPACAHAFLRTMFDDARLVATDRQLTNRKLAGMAVSVKDLFDLAGQVTTAGAKIMSGDPVATSDAMAVSRLKAAGGVIIGRTNMVEFAYSGVGINPHFGTPANIASTDVARIPGGSSSGAAVSVAAGAAFVGLGSDTGGSIRIPAALNGIVGFKSTARLVPKGGALPLSSTLDTVCAVTRSVRDAVLVHEILAAKVVTKSTAPLGAYRLAVVRNGMQENLDATVSKAFERTLARMRAAGAVITEIDLPQLDELSNIQASGGFSAAESYAWHRTRLAQYADSYDPRVRARIQRGSDMTASDYIDLLASRQDWIERMAASLTNFDAVISPTVPMVASPLADVLPGVKQDREFFRVNALLLRNPSVVNMMDGCAISIPCHVAGELPVGLMIWAGAMQDDTVLNLAAQVEYLLQK